MRIVAGDGKQCKWVTANDGLHLFCLMHVWVVDDERAWVCAREGTGRAGRHGNAVSSHDYTAPTYISSRCRQLRFFLQMLEIRNVESVKIFFFNQVYDQLSLIPWVCLCVCSCVVIATMIFASWYNCHLFTTSIAGSYLPPFCVSVSNGFIHPQLFLREVSSG